MFKSLPLPAKEFLKQRHFFRALLFFVFLAKAFPVASQDEKTYLRLTFIGDIMQHSPQIRAAYDAVNDVYDYTSCFKYIAPSIQEADIAIANLEVTLAGPPFSGYPAFSSPDALAVAAKNAGVDVLVTANNHSLDRRKRGLERTIDVLDSLKIPHTGTFKTQAEREKNYPLILEKKGIKIALLNYTYGTNGIPVTPPNIVNMIDTTQIKTDLEKAKQLSADFTIVVYHWGNEYQSLPNKTQRELVRFTKANGADIIIGAHPHVLQPIEFEDGFLTAYSLGNFVSNQRDRYRDGGMVVTATLEIDEANREIKVTDPVYQLVWVYKKPAGNKSEYYILPADDYKARAIVESKEDREKMRLFVSDSRKLFAENNIGFIRESRHEIDHMPSYDLGGKRGPHVKYRTSAKKLPVNGNEPRKTVARPLVQKTEEKEPVKKQEIYRIQFFVSSGELEVSELSETYFPTIYTEKIGNLTRYLTGDYGTREEAERQLGLLIRETRFKDAYVVTR